ncbi:MAG: hypothetical protein K8T10_21910 [Candidatus Eremiobacteraeota bacterium]|nr:hypothetical protein [Candidatus Eremiobacteraeota bacterium]
MRASDMDKNLKRVILNKIRDDVGSYKYSEMVDPIGEDGLIDLLLLKAEKERSGGSGYSSGSYSTTGTRRESVWEKALETTFTVIGSGIWIWISFILSGGWMGFALVIGIFLLVFLGTALFHSIGMLKAVSTALMWIASTAVIIVAIWGIGYVIWKGGPWVVQGVKQWWAWLGGHFQ